jgi:hypothetical protein
MFKYSVKIKKTRGKIDESNKPNQTLTIKSKTRKNKNELFNEAADYLNKKYNLTLESADVHGGETIKVYVGTWGKYNGGSLHGEWVDLSNFATPNTFKKYCHKKLHGDEPDAELMFQDVEGPAWVRSVISEYGMNYKMVWGWLALDDWEKPVVDGYIELFGINGFSDFNELVSSAQDAYLGGEGQDFDDWVQDFFSETMGDMSVDEFLDRHYNWVDFDNAKMYMDNDGYGYNEEEDDYDEVDDEAAEEWLRMGFGTVQDLIDNSLIDWPFVERDYNIELSVASNGCVYHG